MELMGVDLLVGQNFTELSSVQYSRIGNSLTFSDNVVDLHVNLIKNSIVNVGLENPEAVDNLLKLINQYSGCIAGTLAQIG